jgi:hypothetical protein
MTWRSDLILPAGPGNPRDQVARMAANEATARRWQASQPPERIHGMTPNQAAEINEKLSRWMPRLASTDPSSQRRDLFADMLPPGATFDPRRRASPMASGTWGLSQATPGGSFQHAQLPYQPETASPDRQNYPVHRILANRYWRLFIKLDPVIGTGLDMYGEMPWGDCKLTGDGVDGEVRDVYESQWERCNILGLLPAMVREFLGVGEVIPHAFFDDALGIWTYVALHNPDNLEVIDAPFLHMEPIVEFVPDDRLRQILTSSDPDLQKVKTTLPPELLHKLYTRQNLRINTEVNATFMARKLHPYETRGTSILSRMWRVLMLEDGIFNATIATARRHAGPLKVAKLGNPQTNWIPGPDQERRFAELVAQAEVDPHAWIIFHYGLQLEAFGTTDRVMTVDRNWEVLERIKLAALGISRSFLTGELTYASATAGLQVFLRRLQALRSYFESTWLKPKFFKTVAAINGFVKPTQAEVSHGIRVRRGRRELDEDRRLILPTIDWANKLNPMVDNDLIKAYEALERLGVRISKTKKLAAVNLSFEDELRRSIEEDKFENKLRAEYGVPDEKGDPAEISQIIQKTDPSLDGQGEGSDGQEAAPPAGAPRVPPPPPNPRQPPARPTAPAPATPPPAKPEPERTGSPGSPGGVGGIDGLWDERGQAYGWDQDQVEDLIVLLRTGDTPSAFWSMLLPRREMRQVQGPDGSIEERPVLVGYNPHRAYAQGDEDGAWEQVAQFLAEQGYPDREIDGLRQVLVIEGTLAQGVRDRLARFEAALPDDPGELDDEAFGRIFAEAVRGQIPRPPPPRRGPPPSPSSR